MERPPCLHRVFARRSVQKLDHAVLAADATRRPPPAAPSPALKRRGRITLCGPTSPPDTIDADALMIRGFVDESGRFEGLNIVFPQPFSSAQFVLDALQQWQFRPATQDGQAVRVEVLLVIPEDTAIDIPASTKSDSNSCGLSTFANKKGAEIASAPLQNQLSLAV